MRCLASTLRPLVNRRDHFVLPSPQLIAIDLRRAEHDAVGRHVGGVFDDFGRVQQRLGGNAAHVQAHAAQHRPAFDQGHLACLDPRREMRRCIRRGPAPSTTKSTAPAGGRRCRLASEPRQLRAGARLPLRDSPLRAGRCGRSFVRVAGRRVPAFRRAAAAAGAAPAPRAGASLRLRAAAASHSTVAISVPGDDLVALLDLDGVRSRPLTGEGTSIEALSDLERNQRVINAQPCRPS